MKNRLISDKQRKEYERSTGLKFTEKRHSGRTTGIAIKIIGEAMCNPRVHMSIYDHWHEGNKNVDHVKRLIWNILEKLGLDHFKFEGNYLVYNIFKD